MFFDETALIDALRSGPIRHARLRSTSRNMHRGIGSLGGDGRTRLPLSNRLKEKGSPCG
jgi:hypothetical protein